MENPTGDNPETLKSPCEWPNCTRESQNTIIRNGKQMRICNECLVKLLDIAIKQGVKVEVL